MRQGCAHCGWTMSLDELKEKGAKLKRSLQDVNGDRVYELNLPCGCQICGRHRFLVRFSFGNRG